MGTKRLDSKAVGAGVLLLLNMVLWFVQTGLSYAIADGGFWGVGGMVQNFTVVLSEPEVFLFLLALLVAAITLLTRKRAAAIVGLLVLAAYFAYALMPGFSSDITVWLAPACRVLGIVFVAIAIACSNSAEGAHKVVCGIAVTLVLAAWLLGIVFNIIDGSLAGSAFPVMAVSLLRGLLLSGGLVLAALTLTEKGSVG